MKLLMVVLSSLTILTACGNTSQVLRWQDSKISESTTTYRITGSYPVIVGLSKAEEVVINEKISQLRDEIMSDFTRTIGSIPEASLNGKISTLNMTYVRGELSSEKITFSFSVESHIAGAAHPNNYVRIFSEEM